MIKIFNQLATTNSTKDKQAILEANKTNIQLKELLEANLNPYKIYYIKKMPCGYIPQLPSSVDQHQFFMALLKDLEKRYTTGNKAKETICAVFKLFDEDHFELYSKILLKASIGVGTSTVNKVWPNLIPEFKLMLAPNQLPNLTDLQYPLCVQPKYDGYRCIYYKGDLWTRSGLIMPNKNLTAYFSNLMVIDDYIFDGELYLHGSTFQSLTRTLGADDAPIPKGLKYFVYDCMPVSDWEAQKTKLSYNDRLKLINELVNGTIANHRKVIDTPTDLAQNPAEVIEIYKKYLKNGYEGCMLKAQEGKYQWKRVTIKSGEMVKLKPFKSEDLEIIDVIEGEGKFQGTLGSIIVSSCHIAATSVGSGFTDADRKEIWSNKNKYIGKTAEVKYFGITEDKVLRHPIFERIRTDK